MKVVKIKKHDDYVRFSFACSQDNISNSKHKFVEEL